MANIVAIVGRPNVGKSTLFNRLVERRDAIVDNQSGVTRDRHYGKAVWLKKSFTVIDTGGYVVGSEDTFEGAIREQVQIAIEEADVLLFVVDCRTGLTDLDKDFANVLRRTKKPVFLVANKADTTELVYEANEFYELGMGDPHPIMASSGSGTGDLLDLITADFADDEEEVKELAYPKKGKGLKEDEEGDLVFDEEFEGFDMEDDEEGEEGDLDEGDFDEEDFDEEGDEEEEADDEFDYGQEEGEKPEHKYDLEPHGLPRIAVIGRPNVGKSSLVNFMLNSNRSIVTDVAGTTRDAVDAPYNVFGHNFVLTDTAGLRRKSRVHENLEFYSVMRSIQAIESSDVCILVLDATRPMESQDMNILSLAVRNKKGVVIMVNKWDLIEKDHKTAKAFEQDIRAKLGTLNYLPIIFTSVTEKQRIMRVVETAVQVFQNKRQRISTSKLNKVMLQEIQAYPPPAYRGHHIKIKFVMQLPTYNPTFAFYCNHPKHIKDPYKRYLENKLRQNFDFTGVPIQLLFKEK